MDTMNDEPLWVEKYRPQKVVDTILPVELKSKLQGYVDDGFIPNLILSGGPGVGKTTAAKAMFEEMNADYYFINGSMNGNIDTLRTDIADFASSVSFTGRRKYVLLDEADYLNPNSTQPALRGFIEQSSKNCGFILTCNYAARIIEPIHSRCGASLEFAIPPEEKEVLAYEFFTRVQQILKLEKVIAQPEVVAAIITKHFPDWRKVLNVLQNNVKDGKLGNGALSSISDDEIRKLYSFLKGTNFSRVREWAAQYGSDHPKDLFRTMYEMSDEFLTPTGQAYMAEILNRHEYNAAFVANQEINLVAAMVEIMKDVEFN